MTKYKVEDIRAGSRFADDVVLDSLFLVAPPPCPVTEDLLTALAKWGFTTVSCYDEAEIASEKRPQGSPEEVPAAPKDRKGDSRPPLDTAAAPAAFGEAGRALLGGGAEAIRRPYGLYRIRLYHVFNAKKASPR